MTTLREDNLARLRETAKPIAPGQKFVVDEFRPEDAEGVAQLYYTVYGEAFPVDHVYDPDELVRLEKAGAHYLIVGRTEAGDVVGLYAMFRNPPGEHVMEAGSWMVHPEYRSSTLALRLANRLHQNIPEHLGLYGLFGQSVCDHVMTQKLGVRYNVLSCALEVEVLEPRPEENEGWSAGRISLLDQFQCLRDNPHAVVPPGQYEDTLRTLYQTMGLQRELLEDGPPAESTESQVAAHDAASYARMTVTTIGRDFPDVCTQMAADHSGRHVLQIILPLWQPGITLAVGAARKAGFFLGGVLPLWFDRDGLLLQRVAGDIDWSQIKTLTQEACDLRDAVRADAKSVSQEGAA